MRGPVALAVAFATGLIAAAVLGPPHDGDVWWQAWLGATILRTHAIPAALGAETFSAPGAPWTAHEWLFSVLLAASASAHARIVFALAVAACAAGAIALVAARALRGGASPLAASVAVLLALVATIPSLGLRVQVVAWLFAAAFAALALDPRRRAWCVPLAIAWANVHASVLLAPATMAVIAACDALERRPRGASRRTAPPGAPHRRDEAVRDVAVLAGTILAVFLTPLGTRLPAYAIALAQSPIRRYITEWQSPFATPFFRIEIVLATLVVLAVLLPRAKHRLSLAERAVTVTYYVLALLAARHVPVFFLVATPLAASRFGERAHHAHRSSREANAVAAFGAVLSAAAFVCGAVVAAAAARAHPPMPSGAIASVALGARDVRLFCSDFSWCGMAVGKPGVRVFLDGRADPYPPRVFADSIRFATRPGGVDGLERATVNAVLVARGEPLARRLAAAPGWRRTYDDGRYVVFRRG